MTNAGVVTGLAWTAVGGEILFVETSLSKGKGGKLTLTGNLGDVMKESAQIALTYVRSVADRYGVESRYFKEHDLHLHIRRVPCRKMVRLRHYDGNSHALRGDRKEGLRKRCHDR